MNLPKELTTVTPFLKTIALITFITLPIIAFLFGMKYQKSLQSYEINIASISNKKIIPTRSLPNKIYTSQANSESNENNYLILNREWFYGSMRYRTILQFPDNAKINNFPTYIEAKYDSDDKFRNFQISSANVLVSDNNYYIQQAPYEQNTPPSCPYFDGDNACISTKTNLNLSEKNGFYKPVSGVTPVMEIFTSSDKKVFALFFWGYKNEECCTGSLIVFKGPLVTSSVNLGKYWYAGNAFTGTFKDYEIKLWRDKIEKNLQFIPLN